jgi:hypothetical protein
MEVRQLRRCAMSLGKLRPPPKLHLLEYFLELGEARGRVVGGERGEALQKALAVLRGDVEKRYGAGSYAAVRPAAAAAAGGGGGGFAGLSANAGSKELRGQQGNPLEGVRMGVQGGGFVREVVDVTVGCK